MRNCLISCAEFRLSIFIAVCSALAKLLPKDLGALRQGKNISTFKSTKKSSDWLAGRAALHFSFSLCSIGSAGAPLSTGFDGPGVHVLCGCYFASSGSFLAFFFLQSFLHFAFFYIYLPAWQGYRQFAEKLESASRRDGSITAKDFSLQRSVEGWVFRRLGSFTAQPHNTHQSHDEETVKLLSKHFPSAPPDEPKALLRNSCSYSASTDPFPFTHEICQWQMVIFHSFQAASNAHLNRQMGQIINYDKKTGKYIVRIHDATILVSEDKFSPAEKLGELSEYNESYAKLTVPDCALMPVGLRGLTGPYSKWNGSVGKITQYSTETGELAVQFADAKTIVVSPQNVYLVIKKCLFRDEVRPLQFYGETLLSDAVRNDKFMKNYRHGLVGIRWQEGEHSLYNNKVGKIVCYNAERHRMLVRLPSGKEVLVHPDNLTALDRIGDLDEYIERFEKISIRNCVYALVKVIDGVEFPYNQWIGKIIKIDTSAEHFYVQYQDGASFVVPAIDLRPVDHIGVRSDYDKVPGYDGNLSFGDWGECCLQVACIKGLKGIDARLNGRIGKMAKVLYVEKVFKVVMPSGHTRYIKGKNLCLLKRKKKIFTEEQSRRLLNERLKQRN